MQIPKVQALAIMTITYLTDHQEIGDILADFNIEKELITILLKTSDMNVKFAIEKALGGITSSEYEPLINKLIKLDILDIMHGEIILLNNPEALQNSNEISVLDHPLKRILWTVSNISASKNISNTQLFLDIFRKIDENLPIKIKTEIVTIVANTINLMTLGTPFVEDEILFLKEGKMLITDDFKSLITEEQSEEYVLRNNQNIKTLITDTNLLPKLHDALLRNMSPDFIVLVLTCFSDVLNSARYFHEEDPSNSIYENLKAEFGELQSKAKILSIA